jgi:signal peptidase I
VNSHRPINLRALAVVATVIAVLFGALAAVAFTRRSHKTATVNVPYTQEVTFAYSGSAPAGPVYPNGIVSTGDPIFLQFVHQLHVNVTYSVASGAAQQLGGTEQVVARLSGPTGWSRIVPLGGVSHFAGGHATDVVTLDLDSLQALVKQIQKLTGVSSASGYAIAVLARVHAHGTLAGQTLTTGFSPVLNFELAPPQLRPSVAGQSAGFSAAQHGSVGTTATVSNEIVSVPVATLRAVGAGGAVLAVLSILLLVVLIKRSAPFGEAGRIQAQYGHLIVPIAGTAEDLAWAPFDVPNIEALVRLAEACDRLILHYREDTLDTYLVNDEGTVYRYQARHSGVVWGEWSTAPVARMDSVAPPVAAEAARA